ncbi:MAG: response regulator [Bacteroidota bacterium]
MAFGSSFMGRGNKSEKKLSNRSYYKSLIDNKNSCAFLADLDGDILLVNKEAQEFTGYSEEEFLNHRLRELFVTLTGYKNPLDSDDIREFETELYLIKSSSYLVPVQLQLTEIEGSKFLCTILPAIVSEQSEVTDSNKLSGNTSNKELGSNLPSDTVSNTGLTEDEEHDVRNSLNTILGFSTLLLKEKNITSDRKLTGYVKSIIRNSTKLEETLNFSNYSESDNSNESLSRCLLSTIIQKVHILLKSKADENSIELVMDLPGEFAVISDESILFNVVNYLIDKAIIDCRNMFIDVKVRPGKVDGQLDLVIDNIGQGIPKDIKSFIEAENEKSSYESDNQILASEPELSTLLKNLNSINAKMRFEISDDFGDIVLIELPLCTDTSESGAESQSSTTSGDTKKKALIIEDDKLNAIILKNHLQQYVDTSTAFSGDEALYIIETLHNKGVDFDIIFTDIGLPTPWDGITLKQEIINRWAQYKNIPFIAQTGYSAKSYSDKIRESGFKGYLIKPINRNDIKKFVTSI